MRLQTEKDDCVSYGLNGLYTVYLYIDEKFSTRMHLFQITEQRIEKRMNESQSSTATAKIKRKKAYKEMKIRHIKLSHPNDCNKITQEML